MSNYLELCMNGEMPFYPWYFGDITNESGEYLLAPKFWSGERLDVSQHGQLTVELYKHGKAVDFWETYRGIPIVSERFITIVSELEPKAIQAVPVTIKGIYRKREFIRNDCFIMNILSVIDGVDTSNSTVEYYPDDPVFFPNTSGKVKFVHNVHFRAEIVKDRHIFRPSIRPLIIYVSEALRKKIEEAKLTGTYFSDISLRNWQQVHGDDNDAEDQDES